MPRQFPRRRPGAIDGRLFDRTGVLLLGTGMPMLPSWLSGDADGCVAAYGLTWES